MESSSLDLEEVFGPDGFLAKKFKGYERREGQVVLSQMIDRAMSTGQHSLGEGPCGTGKGVAYLVPASWHAHFRKKRTIIATHTIPLQEQLVKKDLPALAEVLPWSFSYALLKGRDNYLCIDRVESRRFWSGNSAEEKRIEEWAETTELGDKSELDFVPDHKVWGRVTADADECPVEKCPNYDRCFYYKAKKIAAESDILVVNYALLFSYLDIRRKTGRQVLILPEPDFIVLDEAHEAPSVASDSFGFKISRFVVTRHANYSDKHRDVLHKEADKFFGKLADYKNDRWRYKNRLKVKGFVSPDALIEVLEAIASVAERFLEDHEGDASADPKVLAKATRTYNEIGRLVLGLREGTLLSDEDKIYFLEENEKNGQVSLASKLYSPAKVLRSELFNEKSEAIKFLMGDEGSGRTVSVSLVSATLTTGGTFDFIKNQVGAPPEALTVLAESPFDFRKQALLIHPMGLPAFDTDAFPGAVTDAIKQVIASCQGRTLGLFTSNKMLNEVHQRIGRYYLGHRVMKQGEMPRTELASIFKYDVSSVLLGTSSFWTGIDVPGDALTAVVIDKLPFQNLSDPLVDARNEREPESSFFGYSLPDAVIKLSQGVGRLIRTQTDIGIVVILDKRLTEKPYGKSFLKSLPNMMRSSHLEDIPRFLSTRRAVAGRVEVDEAQPVADLGRPLTFAEKMKALSRKNGTLF